METMGSRLRVLRKNKGLSLAALAGDLLIPIMNGAGTGIVDYKTVSGAFLSTVETGKKTNLSEDLLQTICEYFEVDREWLVGQEEEEVVREAQADIILEPEVVTVKKDFLSIPIAGGKGSVKRSSIDGVDSYEHYAGMETHYRGLLILNNGRVVKTTLPLPRLNELLEKEGIL